MVDRTPRRIPTFSEKRLLSFQQKKRDDALKKQRSARESATSRARKLVLEQLNWNDEARSSEAAAAMAEDVTLAVADDQADSHAPDAKGGKGAVLKRLYANQLLLPEWMIDVPDDMASSWFVAARPEGQRCLMLVTHGSTTTRLRSGALLHRFPSMLPNGSPATAASSEQYCILDCIYQSQNQTYYCLDLMCWKGYALFDCTTDFRHYWLLSKIAETQALTEEDQPYRIQLLQFHEATPEGLRAAYSGSTDYVKDGLYFINKGTQYESGLSPLALLWKDVNCASYVLDTDAQGATLEQQNCILEYRMDGTVGTSDDPPVVLGQMPTTFVQQLGGKLRPGKLLRFAIGPDGIQFGADGAPIGASLTFLGVGNQRRGFADSISKILFQYYARRDPLTFDQLLQHAEDAME